MTAGEARALQLGNKRTALDLFERAGAVAAQLKQMAVEEEDARHRLFIEDTAKNLFMWYTGLVTDGFPASGTEVRLLLSISGVAADLGYSKLDAGELSAIGKVRGQGSPKHTQLVDGAARSVNSYTTADRMHLTMLASRTNHSTVFPSV